MGAEGGSVPDLRKSALVPTEVFSKVLLEGLLESAGMPSFKGKINASELPALRAFIVNQAWSGYEAQSLP